MGYGTAWMTAGALGAAIFVTGVSLAAQDEERTLTIKNHVFSPQDITVKAHTKVKLVVTNEDTAAEEFESPSLNREKLIRPGQSVTILLPALKPGRYEFFGEFHPDTARGAVVAE